MLEVYLKVQRIFLEDEMNPTALGTRPVNYANFILFAVKFIMKRRAYSTLDFQFALKFWRLFSAPRKPLLGVRAGVTSVLMEEEDDINNDEDHTAFP